MKAQLQRGERKRVPHRQDQFAIQHEAAGPKPPQRLGDLGKVAGQRLARFAHQFHRVAVAECQAAKAVPLRLELPVLAGRQFIRQPRLHGRRIKGKRQSDRSGGHASPMNRAANGFRQAYSSAKTDIVR